MGFTQQFIAYLQVEASLWRVTDGATLITHLTSMRTAFTCLYRLTAIKSSHICTVLSLRWIRAWTGFLISSIDPAGHIYQPSLMNWLAGVTFRGDTRGKNTLVVPSTYISLQRTPIRWFSELLRSFDRLSSSWYLEFCCFKASSWRGTQKEERGS